MVWVWLKGAPVKISSCVWSFEEIGKHEIFKRTEIARRPSREPPFDGLLWESNSQKRTVTTRRQLSALCVWPGFCLTKWPMDEVRVPEDFVVNY